MNGTIIPRWPAPDADGLRGRALRLALSQLSAAPPLPFLASSGPVIVCSARPMDEVLGCGGTIARHVAAGRPVHALVASDGEATHTRQLASAQLGPIRRGEARAALGCLGLTNDDVTFAGAPHLRLSAQIPALTAALSKLLDRVAPEALLLPTPEGDADSSSLSLAVAAARGSDGSAPAVFEYPIWGWRTWPFVRLTIPSLPAGREEFADKAKLMATSLRSAGARRFLRTYTFAVDARDHLAKKREALAQHHSQVERREGDLHWWTLDDVDRGDFARCFFAGYEPFRQVRGASPG